MKRTILFAQVLESALQITTARRRPDHQRMVHRIQGFVVGAAFVDGVYVLASIVLPRPEIAAYVETSVWATAAVAAIAYAKVVGAKCPLGYEKAVHRVQGLVTGSTLAFGGYVVLTRVLALPGQLPVSLR